MAMLKHLEIDASLCEAFKKMLQQTGWQITHQDVGQTELVGYGYVIAWEKGDAKVILHYSDRQGVAQANLEISENVFNSINVQIQAL